MADHNPESGVEMLAAVLDQSGITQDEVTRALSRTGLNRLDVIDALARVVQDATTNAQYHDGQLQNMQAWQISNPAMSVWLEGERNEYIVAACAVSVLAALLLQEPQD